MFVPVWIEKEKFALLSLTLNLRWYYSIYTSSQNYASVGMAMVSRSSYAIVRERTKVSSIEREAKNVPGA